MLWWNIACIAHVFLVELVWRGDFALKCYRLLDGHVSCCPFCSFHLLYCVVLGADQKLRLNGSTLCHFKFVICALSARDSQGICHWLLFLDAESFDWNVSWSGWSRYSTLPDWRSFLRCKSTKLSIVVFAILKVGWDLLRKITLTFVGFKSLIQPVLCQVLITFHYLNRISEIRASILFRLLILPNYSVVVNLRRNNLTFATTLILSVR